MFHIAWMKVDAWILKMSGSLPYHRKFPFTSGLHVSKAIALKDLRAIEPPAGRLKLTKLYTGHSALTRSAGALGQPIAPRRQRFIIIKTKPKLTARPAHLQVNGDRL